MQRDEVVKLWKFAREKTGIDITPQKLRQWFCSEMMRLGVSETHVDAFCGRVPKSVLARHYTDFSPEKLKEIYEKAELVRANTFAIRGKRDIKQRETLEINRKGLG
jgi:intergrase/recombinase